MDTNIYQALLEQVENGRKVALATVVSTRGSVPRHAGSKMIIDPENGALIGTIGGGCGEADVIAAARDVVSSGKPTMVQVELLDSIDSFSPAVCGGVMHVFVEPVS
ncbi:MAG TPA: XdhC family protein [Longimicrobiales bacterium]|nr:XdhC family protein [Longimicrobiales bacterium]